MSSQLARSPRGYRRGYKLLLTFELLWNTPKTQTFPKPPTGPVPGSSLLEKTPHLPLAGELSNLSHGRHVQFRVYVWHVAEDSATGNQEDFAAGTAGPVSSIPESKSVAAYEAGALCASHQLPVTPDPGKRESGAGPSLLRRGPRASTTSILWKYRNTLGSSPPISNISLVFVLLCFLFYSG